MQIIEILRTTPAAWLAIVGVLGLLVGSFLNVVIYRLPVMLLRAWGEETGEAGRGDSEAFNLVVPRSRCRHCDHGIAAWENIPLVSFALLKGRCRHCRVRISLRYPAIELLSGVLSVVVGWHFGVSGEALGALVLTWSLITLACIDLDHQLLPDVISLPVLWLGLGLSLFWTGDATLAMTRDAVIGVIVGYGVLWTLFQAFKLVTGKEGMGYGDFKLLALLGAWLGWQVLPLIALLAAGVGAIVGIAMIGLKRLQRQTPIPFGPYLAAAGWVALLWGTPIMNAYLTTMAP